MGVVRIVAQNFVVRCRSHYISETEHFPKTIHCGAIYFFNSHKSLMMDPAPTPLLLPPPNVTSNFVNPSTYAVATISIGSITIALATFFFLTRLYTSIRSTRSIAYDDYVCASAILFSATFLGLVISSREDERHVWDIPTSIYTAHFEKVGSEAFNIPFASGNHLPRSNMQFLLSQQSESS